MIPFLELKEAVILCQVGHMFGKLSIRIANYLLVFRFRHFIVVVLSESSGRERSK